MPNDQHLVNFWHLAAAIYTISLSVDTMSLKLMTLHNIFPRSQLFVFLPASWDSFFKKEIWAYTDNVIDQEMEWMKMSPR